ncbi:unnamed protein product, partial [Discosporangium mesarthrocarpum]
MRSSATVDLLFRGPDFTGCHSGAILCASHSLGPGCLSVLRSFFFILCVLSEAASCARAAVLPALSETSFPVLSETSFPLSETSFPVPPSARAGLVTAQWCQVLRRE